MPAQARPPGDPPPRILLTRPAGQGTRFAAALAARLPGAEILQSPLMAPVFLSPDPPQAVPDAVIFTSATGVEAAGRLGWSLPRRAFCVGTQTAREARDAGFQAEAAGGDAAALVAMLLAGLPPGRLLHLRGVEARGDVAERLTAGGIPTAEAVVYDQAAQPLSPAARAWLAEDRPVIVPLFSPRSAALFAAEAEGARAPLLIAALSPAVAALAPASAGMLVAACPDADAMSVIVDMLAVS